MAMIYKRMPVILPPKQFDVWLSGEAGTESLMPYPADGMRAYPVDRRVGNLKNSDAGLLYEISAGGL